MLDLREKRLRNSTRFNNERKARFTTTRRLGQVKLDSAIELHNYTFKYYTILSFLKRFDMVLVIALGPPLFEFLAAESPRF